MANQPVPDDLLSPLASIFRDFLGGEADSTGFPAPRAPTWAVPFSWHNPPDVPFASVVTHGVKVLMDFVANGLRILFALVFLSSFVFRPLIQQPVSRLWYGAMNSGKPLFTMLFGAIGTVAGLVQLAVRMT